MFPRRQMAGLLARGLVGRGRRLYLIVAAILFLISMSLLMLKAWTTPRPVRLPDLSVAWESAHYSSFHPEDQTLPTITQKKWEELIQRDTQRGVMWLVQVSDIHMRGGEEALEETQFFKQFVDDILTFIQPAAVLVTGDLTNSKTFGVKLAELPEEWRRYQLAVKDKLSHTNTTLWLDLPGNHDNFDEVEHTHFRYYALQPEFRIARLMSQSRNGPNVTLVPVDASLKPGIRAYNFLGHLTHQHFNVLKGAIKRGVDRGDVVIAYGHYPTSTIVSGGEERQVLAGAAAYLCGHLHAGLGLIDTMWTKHNPNLMELELADWTHRHRYRLVVIDGGEVKWIDVTHPTWPIVLLSSLTYHQKTRNTLTYVIRLVVFSNEEVSNVALRVDDDIGHWTECERVAGPLYVGTLTLHTFSSPSSHDHFIRTLQVLVGNKSGSRSLLRVGMTGVGFQVSQPSTLAEFVLSIKLHSLFLVMYLSGLALCLLVLMLGKYLVNCECLLPKKFLAASFSLTHNRTLVNLILIFLLYPLIGPWYFGPLAQEQYGVVFMWGIFVTSASLPGQLTFPDAFFMGITFQFPFFILVYLKMMMRCGTPQPRCLGLVKVLFIMLGLIQVVAVLTWLVLDSLVLNGCLRLLLLILAITIWRRV